MLSAVDKHAVRNLHDASLSTFCTAGKSVFWRDAARCAGRCRSPNTTRRALHELQLGGETKRSEHRLQDPSVVQHPQHQFLQ